MIERLLLWLMPNFVKRVEKVEKSLSNEMVARKNELNRVEKEVNKDWVGDEIDNEEKEKMIKTLEDDSIIDEEKLK